jgi:serine/threonine-protein kinase
MEEFLAGTSGQLAAAIRECGNVVIPFDVVVSSQGRLARQAPDYFQQFAVGRSDVAEAPVAAAAFVPPEIFASRALSTGFRYYDTDRDDKVRSANLLINYEGAIYPSAALQLAAAYLHDRRGAIEVDRDAGLRLGSRELPIDNRGRMLLRFPREGLLYPTLSAIDVLTGEADRTRLAGKAVIIAATNPVQCVYLETATAGEVATYTYSAATVQQLISGSGKSPLVLSGWANLLVISVMSVLAALFLPRLPLVRKQIALLAFMVLWTVAVLLLFQTFGVIAPLVYPLLTLALFAAISIFVKQSPMAAEPARMRKSEEPERRHSGKAVAFDPEADEEITMSEIPRRLLNGSEGEQASFRETVRLDFEAVSRTAAAADLGPPTSESQPINIDLGTDPQGKPARADKDFESTRVISTDLTPDDSQPLSEPEPAPGQSSDSDPAGAVRATAPAETGAADREEEDEVKFSADGQPLSFGRYRVVEPVGSGAMGTVYKGRDPAIDRSVALKTIRFDSIADSSEVGELKERLIREAIAAGNLSHPNIVTIYDVGVQGNLQYIAMEYIAGYTLEALLKRNLELNYRIVADIIKQVNSALEYAHNTGVVHRDIKPANIMVMDEFKVKVMDFGIAHFRSSSMTQTGVAMGTPSYISPELLQGHEVTPATDIYSLGVVLYELLTRRKPFVAENISSLIYKIVHEQPPAPTSIDGKIPALFDHIVKKSLAKKPQDRYRSAKEFGDALGDFTYSMKKAGAVV